jgi:hypothetical protein
MPKGHHIEGIGIAIEEFYDGTLRVYESHTYHRLFTIGSLNHIIFTDGPGTHLSQSLILANCIEPIGGTAIPPPGLTRPCNEPTSPIDLPLGSESGLIAGVHFSESINALPSPLMGGTSR